MDTQHHHRDSRTERSGSAADGATFFHGVTGRRRLAVVALVAVVAVALSAVVVFGVEPVAATNSSGPVEGSVDLDADLDDDEVELGTEQSVTVELTNDGEVLTDGTHPTAVRELVTRAEATDVSLVDEPEGVEVRTGEQRIGDIDRGDTETASFDVYVDEDEFDPGDRFTVDAVVTYDNVTVTEYERDGDDVDVETASEEQERVFTNIVIEVADEVRFDVTDVDHDVQVDETGAFTVEIENTGSEDLDDVVVTAESPDSELFFGSGTATSEQSVGEWEAGETRTVTYRLGATDEALAGPYPIELSIEFEDEDGDAGVESTQTEIEPADRQSYTVEDVDHNVSIGDDGVLTVELANDGPQDLTDATVALSSGDPAITFPEADGDTTTTQTFVGDWGANETTNVSVRTNVGADAVARNYSMEVAVDARNENDTELNTQTREFGFEPEPEQRYTVENVDHTVSIGDDGLVELELTNRGPQNVTAAEVELSSSDPDVGFGSGTAEDAPASELDLDLETPTPASEAAVGDWGVNETVTLTYRVDVDGDAVEREYPLEATVSARDENDSELSDRSREVVFEPLSPQRYTIEDVTHDVAVGDDGVVELELRNDGPLDVSDAAVEVGARDSALAFGSGAAGDVVDVGEETFEAEAGGEGSSEAYVGDWEAGETRTVAYQVSASDDALARNYTMDATVTARDGNDDRLNERTREFGFEPLAEQTFAVENTENTLRVGEDGDVVGSVTNDGERTAEGVVVLLASEPSNALPRETEYAVGDLEPGETAEFTFRLGISEEGEAGPRVLEVETRYRSPGGDARLTSSQDLLVNVEPERDSFAPSIDASFEPGESGTVTVELANSRDEPVENVRAKLFPDSPVSSDDDEAFVSRIEPGESATMIFDLGVDSGATAKEYPISLDVRYDDERGETQLSGTYQLPVEVTEPADAGVPLWLVGVVLVVFAGVLVFFRERVTQAGRDVRARLGGSTQGPPEDD